jgi:PAS domain S-box-containing protein
MDDVQKPGQLSEAQAKAIFLIAEDAIISVDAGQRIILFNEGAEKLFGYAHDEILGQPLDWLIPEANREHHSEHLQPQKGWYGIPYGSLHLRHRRRR